MTQYVTPTCRLLKENEWGIFKELQDKVSFISGKELFTPITYSNFMESVDNDFVYGLFYDDELTAVCLIVKNRFTTRNLCFDIGDKEFNIRRMHKGLKLTFQ